ncbi:unnamed protein product [Effrenium voratum]|nr:unnamed protein product [Effrenium voratum]
MAAGRWLGGLRRCLVGHWRELPGLTGARSRFVRTGRPRDRMHGPSDAVAGGLGRLAPPVAEGRPVQEESPEDLEEPSEVGSLLAVAPTLHKFAGLEPLPADALDQEDSDPPSLSIKDVRKLSPPPRRYVRAPPTLLQRLAEVDKLEGKGRERQKKRRGQFEFNDDEPIRVRVLDVDALPLEELHRAFMYTLVRRRPAEVCVRVASRLAMFRDKPGQLAYENMVRDCSWHFGATHGPELLALFTRCYSTISVPFMLDYTRQFGHFSRKFLAEQVEKSLRPGFLDFMRYQDQGGVRKLPLTISKPWSLQAYTRLMMKSYLKSRIYEQLKLHGHIPEVDEDTDPDMPVEARVMEQLSRHGALKVPEPSAPRAPKPKPEPEPEPEVPRPALLDAIMEARARTLG